MTTLINNYKHHTLTKGGVVTNTKTGNVKSIWTSKVGYCCVDIQEEGKAKKHYLHRLLAEHYLPNPDNRRTVNHINGNKLDNKLENLEWATDSENIKHAYNNGLNHCSTKKITDKDLKEILQAFLSGQNLTDIVKNYEFSIATASTHLAGYAKRLGKHKEFLVEKCRQKKQRNSSALHSTYSVNMISTTTGDVIKSFISLSEATKFLDKNSSGPISNVLAGRQKTAYGYTWIRT